MPPSKNGASGIRCWQSMMAMFAARSVSSRTYHSAVPGVCEGEVGDHAGIAPRYRRWSMIICDSVEPVLGEHPAAGR